jgi:hypothetical protein
MEPLFQATSVIDKLPRRDVVFRKGVIHWYKTQRPGKRPPYHRLIDGYGQLDDVRRMYTERAVDECFTAGEIQHLEAFLGRIDGTTMDLRDAQRGKLDVRPVTLPVGAQVVGYRDLPVGGYTERYRLSELDGYALSFDVQGYIDLTESGYTQKLERSASYIHRALQILGRDAGIKQAQLVEVAEKLYLRDGLHIADDQPDNLLDGIELAGVATNGTAEA